MKQYKVTVNNTEYDVVVEPVVGGAARPAVAPVARPAVAPAPAAAPAPAPAARPAAPAAALGGGTVTCPMPGTILDVKIKAGDAVKAGDLLFILEAMKMQNEIYAPCDGTVESVAVANGATPNSGDVLCVIK